MTIHYSETNLNNCLAVQEKMEDEVKPPTIQEYIQMTTSLLEELIEA